MRRYIVGFAAIAIVAASAYAVVAGIRYCATSSHSTAAEASSPSASGKRGAPSPGAVRGNFDPAMSGVCRFACATKLEYKAADVLAQPGAVSGKLTQCPVSGVVFVVDEGRPKVSTAGNEYTTCCGNCADKLRSDPSHYLEM